MKNRDQVLSDLGELIREDTMRMGLYRVVLASSLELLLKEHRQFADAQWRADVEARNAKNARRWMEENRQRAYGGYE